MKNLKACLILIDSYERFYFFKRFFEPLKKLGYKPLVISSYISIHKKCKNLGISSTIVKPQSSHQTHNIENCLEYSTGLIKYNLAQSIYSAFYETARDIFIRQEIILCFLWNGSRTQSRAIAKACAEENISTLFLELSNIDKKIFADPLGTNTESLLYKNPKILTKFSGLVGSDFLTWKDCYLKNKYSLHIVQQARSSKKIKYEYIADYLLSILGLSQPLFSLKSITRNLKKSKTFFENRKKNREMLKKPKNYIFLPLQVSTDSQIKFHSEINNLDAIELAATQAKNQGCRLIVKTHPAEEDSVFLNQVLIKKNELGFLISEENTFTLIRDSSQVYVINSTVALEALLIGKPVSFYGKSIYKLLNENNISKYLHGYLLDIDYFDNKVIDSSPLKTMIDRAFLTENTSDHW